MNERGEGVLIGVVGIIVCALVWTLGSTFEAWWVVRHCDNYKSFVYGDTRYTCEKVEGELK